MGEEFGAVSVQLIASPILNCKGAVLNFEIMKYEILSSVYHKRFNKIEKAASDILKELEIRPSGSLSEMDQKSLNQINLIFKKFDKIIGLNCSENFYLIKTKIKKHMVNLVRNQVKKPVFINYETWRKSIGLSEAGFRVMLANVSSVQLSVGCSNFCRRCNEWALPGVRKHFTFDAAVDIITQIFQTGNNEFSLYSASDPLDFRHKGRDITDIIKIISDNGYVSKFGLLTKIPKGSEKILDNLLKINGDFAVSITDKNRKRVKVLEEKSGKKFNIQHDTGELLIPAGMDEDFTTIKSSIIDNLGVEITPEGASIIVPTFTSALNLTGQKRIPVNHRTNFFLKKQVGMDGLAIEYFKPFTAVNFKNKEFTLNRLLFPQIENIILDSGTDDRCVPPGMTGLKEYFTTFEKKAVAARKKMVPVIIKRLKKESFNHQNQKHNKGEYKRAKKKFKEKCNDYLDFCRPEKLLEFKKFTFSFFLKSIMDYIRNNPYAGEIVLYLRGNDRKFYMEYYNRIIKDDHLNFTNMIYHTDLSTFDIFQMMMFKLIDNPYDKEINEFIRDNPSMYNPATGRFVSYKNCHEADLV